MKIDLLPPEYRLPPQIQLQRLARMIVGGVLCLMALGFSVYQYQLTRPVKIQLQTVRRELASYENQRQKLERVEDLHRKIAAYRQELQVLEDSYQPYVILMDGIAAALPQSVWLNQLQINSDGVIALQGKSLDFGLIGHFLDGLNLMDSIQGCQLQKISEVTHGQFGGYSFEIQLTAGRAR